MNTTGRSEDVGRLYRNKRGVLDRLREYDEYITNVMYQWGLRVPRFVWKVLEYSGDGIVWLTLASLLLVGAANSALSEKEQEILSRKSWYGFLVSRILGMCCNIVGSNNAIITSHASSSIALKDLGPNLMLGLLVDLMEVGLLKGVFKRPRPGHNALAGDMKIVVSVDAHSFPSGHSSRCVALHCFVFLHLALDICCWLFCYSVLCSIEWLLSYHMLPCRASFIALLVRLMLPPSFFVLRNICIIWAVVVALSRCMMGRHHFSDVMAGLLLGSLTLYIVTRVRSYCYLL